MQQNDHPLSSTGTATLPGADVSPQAASGGRLRLVLAHSAWLSWVGYLALALIIQWIGRAWTASYTAYSDEPSHFVGAVMIRDWLASFDWTHPLSYATNYYNHYPYFAIGYWPPMFHGLAALVELVAGVGRAQTLFVPAAAAALCSACLYLLLREKNGHLAALSGGLLYLFMPEAQRLTCAVMVDHLTAGLCLLSLVVLLAYLRRPAWPLALLWAVVCAAAILSKYTAVCLLGVPFCAALAPTRRHLWRVPSFWAMHVLAALIVAPWILATYHMANVGLPDPKSVDRASRLIRYGFAMARQLTAPLAVALLPGLLGLTLRRAWTEPVRLAAALFLACSTLLYMAPLGFHGRYMMMPVACLITLSLAGWSALWSFRASWERLGRLAVCAAGLIYAGYRLDRYNHADALPAAEAAVAVHTLAGEEQCRVLAPTSAEGPFIAEYLAREPKRPFSSVLRPGKLLVRSDWFGGSYDPLYTDAAGVAGALEKERIRFVVLAGEPKTPHDRLLADVVARGGWKQQASVTVSGRVWTVHERR